MKIQQMKRQISLQQHTAGLGAERVEREFRDVADKDIAGESKSDSSSDSTKRKTTSMFTSAPRNNDTSKIAMRSAQVQQAYVQYLSKQTKSTSEQANQGAENDQSRGKSAVDVTPVDPDPAQII